MNNSSKNITSDLLSLLKVNKTISNEDFLKIYHKYNNNLYKYCYYLTQNKSDTEELLQEVWFKFIQTLKSGFKYNKILPYLLKVAKSLNTDRLRKINNENGARLVFVESQILDKMVNIFDDDDFNKKREIITIIELVLNGSNEKSKEAFVLHWFDGLSYKEISELTGETLSCIKMRCARALNEIIKIINPPKQKKIK